MVRRKRMGKTAGSGKAKTAVAAHRKTKVRMENPDPFDLLSKSARDLRSNLLVIVPSLLSLISLFFLLVFAGIQVVILFLLYPSESLSALDGGDFTIFLPFAFLFALLDVILAVVILVYFRAAEFGVIADVVSGRKTSFWRMLSHGKTLFSRVLGFFIAVFLVFLVPTAVLLAVLLLLGEISWIAGLIVGLIFSLLFLFFLIAFSIITLFGSPILTDRKLSGFFSGFQAFAKSFNYAKANPGHVLITFAFFLCLSIIVWVASYLVGFPSTLMYAEVWTLPHGSGILETSLYYIVYVVSSILEFLISLVGSVFILLFVFNSYFSRNKIDWK